MVMRRYGERQLKPWARNLKDAILVTGLAAVLVLVGIGVYLFLTNLPYYVNQQSYGLLPGNPAMVIGLLLLMMWGLWYAAESKKARPLLVGLDVSAMVLANLFFSGFWVGVGTAIGIILLLPIVVLIEKIRNLYSQEVQYPY
jgi:hypothetical protein